MANTQTLVRTGTCLGILAHRHTGCLHCQALYARRAWLSSTPLSEDMVTAMPTSAILAVSTLVSSTLLLLMSRCSTWAHNAYKIIIIIMIIIIVIIIMMIKQQ